MFGDLICAKIIKKSESTAKNGEKDGTFGKTVSVSEVMNMIKTGNYVRIWNADVPAPVDNKLLGDKTDRL